MATLGRHVFGGAIPEGVQVDASEQCLALTQDHGRDGQVDLVDLARTKVLSDGVDSAGDLDVSRPRCFTRTLQRGLGAVGDEVERRAAVHLDRRARMVREHEGGRVVGRIVTPPSPPAIIGPFAPDRAEHVPSHDEGTEAVHRAPGERVVGTDVTAALALHRAEGSRGEVPLEQLRASLAQGLLQALLGSRRKAVDRYPQAGHPDPRHLVLRSDFIP